MRTITRIIVLGWTKISTRHTELASELGGTPLVIPQCYFNHPAPVRYVRAAMWTLFRLARASPNIVIVSTPPIPAAAVTWLYCRARGADFVLDAHPGSFGLMHDRWSAKMQTAFRLLVRRALCVAVTTPSLAGKVSRWGGTPLLLHESPVLATTQPTSGTEGHKEQFILFPTSGGRDEPLPVMLLAAQSLPALSFVLTGYTAQELSERGIDVPANVSAVGWVNQPRFQSLVERADAVVVLTDEQESVMRTAYEAAYRGRALVVSDTPATRQFFSHAVRVENRSGTVASGIETALALAQDVIDAQTSQCLETWNAQIQEFREMLS